MRPSPELDHGRRDHVALDSALAPANPDRPDRDEALAPEVAEVRVRDLEEVERLGRVGQEPAHSLVPDEHYVVPGHGVYAAWAHGHPAAVNVGVRPTFETGRGLLVEAHLVGFDGDIYGETLRIAFLERLRGERRFESVDELVEQMNRDVDEAKTIAESGRA